ncbi:hypothetical protein JTB14_013166 [Gonioctena quinquepunctata]|nr:hypothetical protein JTB14_013166 [Gonioctena quinquepunctata]
MLGICQSCTLKITSLQPRITWCNFPKKYHATCVKLTNSDLAYIQETSQKWSCPQCVTKLKRSRNADSPNEEHQGEMSRIRDEKVMSTADQFQIILNELSKLSMTQTTLLGPQKEIAEDMSKIKKTQLSLRKDMKKINDNLENHEQRLSTYETIIDQCQINMKELMDSNKKLQESPHMQIPTTSEDRIEINHLLQGCHNQRGQIEGKKEYLQCLRQELKQRIDNGEIDLTITYIEGIPKIITQTKNHPSSSQSNIDMQIDNILENRGERWKLQSEL